MVADKLEVQLFPYLLQYSNALFNLVSNYLNETLSLKFPFQLILR